MDRSLTTARDGAVIEVLLQVGNQVATEAALIVLEQEALNEYMSSFARLCRDMRGLAPRRAAKPKTII